jgi:hypothetical protein
MKQTRDGTRVVHRDFNPKSLIGIAAPLSNERPHPAKSKCRWITAETRHSAVHCCRGGEVLLRFLLLPCVSVELAEAEVAVGDEGRMPIRSAIAAASRYASMASVAAGGSSAVAAAPSSQLARATIATSPA